MSTRERWTLATVGRDGLARRMSRCSCLPAGVRRQHRLTRAALVAVATLTLLLGVAPVPPPAAADTGPWVWPLAGPHEVSRAFDPPATRYSAGHRGADLPGSTGDPVRAAGAGIVSYAGLLAGRGVLVIVHGELRTTYEPVTALAAVGARVAAGQLIGALDAGHEGCPVEACLHWGLKRADTYLDPVLLVERRPSRLLPLGQREWAPRTRASTGLARQSAVGAASLAGATAGIELKAVASSSPPLTGRRERVGPSRGPPQAAPPST